MEYKLARVPDGGERISLDKGRLRVPDKPIIPFIEGDGTGPDIWRASVRVFDAAVEKAYGGRRADRLDGGLRRAERPTTDSRAGCPTRRWTRSASSCVGIKGPLTTPVGGGIRSLNVALRQLLDLYVCLRPVRWFKGVPSPVQRPEKVDMVIFRENTEDIYAGIEFESGADEAQKFLRVPAGDASPSSTGRSASRRRTGIGLKPVSREGTRAAGRAAIQLRHGRTGARASRSSTRGTS